MRARGAIVNAVTGTEERSAGRELGVVHLFGRLVHARTLLRSPAVRAVSRRVPTLRDHVDRRPAAALEVETLAATAVVLRAYLGGEILVADVLRDGRRLERHAWNRLPSGLTLDLTRDQFRTGELLGAPTVQEPLLLGNARERHALLAEHVAAALAATAS